MTEATRMDPEWWSSRELTIELPDDIWNLFGRHFEAEGKTTEEGIAKLMSEWHQVLEDKTPPEMPTRPQLATGLEDGDIVHDDNASVLFIGLRSPGHASIVAANYVHDIILHESEAARVIVGQDSDGYHIWVQKGDHALRNPDETRTDRPKHA